MEPLYLGRIVAVGLTPAKKLALMYRVSSRSFPNREPRLHQNRVAIVPKTGYETDIFRNPYIAYHCAAIIPDVGAAVLSNGSHTDPIAEKIAGGMNIRDALALTLTTLDYEHDDYQTPRIVAVAKIGEDGWLGCVRHDGLAVRRLPLTAGRCFYLSTYERNFIAPENCAALPEVNAAAACRHILRGDEFANFAHPVCAVAAVETDGEWQLAVES
ncbi:IMP cyclohydrolase [Planctomycetales bacterium]|nr:IMP cyclohydrolase [Planctomycetales bacterium]GHT00677.1 IMP cyclohydrolase [Planctomycetales bacterium]GHT07970.1 IMP cyclohydrolase [Planctomycetales bacterium]